MSTKPRIDTSAKAKRIMNLVQTAGNEAPECEGEEKEREKS